jgi:DNA (cytosine-5)-methyltransferase 1
MKNRPTVLDLFSGAGGLSLGFEYAGFEVVGGTDYFNAAGKTFQASHPNSKFICAPIEELNTGNPARDFGLSHGELDCLVGGPPCQAYSVYNHKRGTHDERANLFKEYLKIVDSLFPKWVVIENVTGLRSIDGGAILNIIKSELQTRGYNADWKILRSEDYGVPQERRRIVFLANRVGLPLIWPKQGFGGPKPFNNIWDAISDLPELENGEKGGDFPYYSSPKSNLQQKLRKNSSLIRNHEAPTFGAVNLERIKHISPGGSWRDIPYDLLPEGMKKAKRSDHTKRYGRMKWEGLSCTILTKCDIHWGAYIHPEQDRAISVREAARLQTFPDKVFFYGNKTEQYTQVGNAVPPLMAQAIGESILSSRECSLEHINNRYETIV